MHAGALDWNFCTALATVDSSWARAVFLSDDGFAVTYMSVVMLSHHGVPEDVW